MNVAQAAEPVHPARLNAQPHVPHPVSTGPLNNDHRIDMTPSDVLPPLPSVEELAEMVSVVPQSEINNPHSKI